jgi:hypothetical protein
MSNSATVKRERGWNYDAWARKKTQPLHVNEWRVPSKPMRREELSHPTTSTDVREDSIEQAIRASRSILALPSDWDDEGAERVSEETWDLAVAILRRAVQTARTRLGSVLPAPTIGPVADGSIDLYWKTPFKLLISIKPKGAEESSDFFGERDEVKVHGPLNTANPGFEFLRLLVK